MQSSQFSAPDPQQPSSCQNIQDLSLNFPSPNTFDITIEHILRLKIMPFLIEQKTPPIQFQENDLSDEEGRSCANPKKILSYNRKEKSLAELTKKFIEKFEGAESSHLALDQVTQEMKVERRRIYDIINIMQSLNVVTKVKKNIYNWKGLKQAVMTIQNLGKNQNQDNQFFMRNKKQKSLELLASYFLKVFSQQKQVITLERASGFIINDESDRQNKTKVRRLYDIVNVFKSLGLIRKVKNQGAKPGYEWMGCENLAKIIQQQRIKNYRPKPEQNSGKRQMLNNRFNLETLKIKRKTTSTDSSGQMQMQMERGFQGDLSIEIQEQRKEFIDQGTYEVCRSRFESEKQEYAFNGFVGNQSYFSSILCKERENGVRTLRQLIKTFNRNLWKIDSDYLEKQKKKDEASQEFKYQRGFRTNRQEIES